PGTLQLLDKTQERIMTKLKVVLALAAAAVVASTFAPEEASARWRSHPVGCIDRLPAYGYDGCGLREFGYGPDSCWDRREAYTRQGPRARRVWVSMLLAMATGTGKTKLAIAMLYRLLAT